MDDRAICSDTPDYREYEEADCLKHYNGGFIKRGLRLKHYWTSMSPSTIMQAVVSSEPSRSLSSDRTLKNNELT